MHRTSLVTTLLSSSLFAVISVATAQDLESEPVGQAAIDHRSGILFESENPEVLLVQDVLPDSAAARARIEPGDTIVTIDDEKFASAAEAEAYLTTLDGSLATIVVLRDGRHRAVIYANPLADIELTRIPIPKFGQPAGIGVKVRGNADVRVIAVWEGSPAARAGILPGDRLVAVNGLELRGTDAFVAAIASQDAGEPVEITIRRNAIDQVLLVQPERWTLAFDEEPRYLEGWEGRVDRGGCGRFDFADAYAAMERAYQPDDNDALEDLIAEVSALREELTRMRIELAETREQLVEMQDGLNPGQQATVRD